MRSRPKRGVSLAVAFFGLVVVAGSTTDPTENSFYVRVFNDTRAAVTLYHCGGDHCEKRSQLGRLPPRGTSGPVFASAGVSNPIAVVNADGHLRGCLPLDFKTVTPGLRVRVSTAVTC